MTKYELSLEIQLYGEGLDEKLKTDLAQHLAHMVVTFLAGPPEMLGGGVTGAAHDYYHTDLSRRHTGWRANWNVHEVKDP